MDVQDLVQLFRKQVSDEAQPYLWDDEEVLQYAIDAQDIFVRRMGGISDMTVLAADDLTNLRLHDLVLTVEEPFSAFSSYILRIRSARILSTKRDVAIISEADFSHVRISDYGQVNPIFMDDEDTGVVTHAIIGMKDNNLRWYRVPEEADTCRLHVYRLPYPRIEAQEDDLEIDEQHHIHLLKWMKHMSYGKEDSETYDKDLADKNEAAFEKYCEAARQEKDRQRFKPGLMHYAGL